MKARKIMSVRLCISFLFFIFGIVLEHGFNITPIFALIVSYALVGYDIIWKAIRNIFKGRIFDENFLMSIATIGAFVIGEYTEGVAVMLFYQVGEFFQSYAVDKSRKSISTLMDIRPDYANVKRGEDILKVEPDDVHLGETVVIKAGERVPLDCVVLSGNSTLDTSALTGESLPRDVSVGNELLSGSININGLITARVTKEYAESTVSKILDLVENASDKKSKPENFITKFARYYTPVVVILAALLAIAPPLLYSGESFADWGYRALSFLVVSCPCALVISIPLSFYGGIGGASKKGILIKGSNYIEVLAKTKTVVFDKTGTLTKGVFNVSEINSVDVAKEEVLKYATYAEIYSNHPISFSLKKAYKDEVDLSRIKDVEEIAGHGVKAIVDSRLVVVGNEKLMKEQGIEISVKPDALGTVVYVAVDNKYIGYILISDEIKADSKAAIKSMKKLGINKTIMLTGDAKKIGEKVADELEIDEVYTELLPTDKVNITEGLIERTSGGLAFVGDGINDAPVLARADIGIAMGGVGSDAAIEAADVVIMTDEPSKIAVAINIARKTLLIVKQNIVFALVVKTLILILTAFGLSNMWEAVFADVGVSVLAILNAIRMLNVKKFDNIL